MRISIMAAAATLSVVVLWAPLATAQPRPYESEQRELARRVRSSARSPSAIVPLLELHRGLGNADPRITTSELDRLSRSPRLPAHLRSLAAALHARALGAAGDVDEADRRIEELGYLRDFLVVGPFDNEGKAGFDRAFPPETMALGEVRVDERFRGKEREVGFRRFPPVSRYGYVSFDAVFRPFENVCGYALTTVHSDSARPLGLWVGGGGATKVWWNGQEVLRDGRYREPHPDRHLAMVGAHAGPNRLLVKTCAMDGRWGFYARLSAPEGGPPGEGWRIDASAFPAVEEGHGAPLPSGPTPPLAALSEAASREDVRARDLESLARLLVYTGADDPSEHRARQLAARAAELEPTVARLELAATLSEQRGEAMRFVQRAQELFPRDAETLLLRARVRSSGLHPPEALPLLERIPPRGTAGLEARLVRADVYGRMELGAAAEAELGRASERAPRSHRLAVARRNAARANGRADRGVELAREAVALDYTDLQSRRILIADALRRGEEDTVLDHLAILERLAADDGATLRYAARIYEALDRSDDALASLRAARALTPHDPANAVAEGRLLLRLEQDDAAAIALREALELRPQDAETRELLEQVEPRERMDERYAVDTETLLSRRREASGYPISVLQDLTVNTVYENGLGSSFRQVAMQVHDAEGARQLRTYGIQFDPGSQRLHVRLARVVRADGDVLEGLQTYEQSLGEPWYRIYYDTRARVVVFPDLEPGDMVELRWRVDDVIHRNLFADYYGDLRFLRSESPMAHVEYVLITPRSRRFHFNEPDLDSLRHERQIEGDQRIDRFVAEGVAALRSEPSMPGLTEVLPYLHVSTYRSWSEVGRWYWGLIQDQLYADDDLKDVVRELVAGESDLRSKVQRIHEWVIDHTRYVGLEFGIHGYKPYRVPQVVDRGFGDCKDKASLLYTMLREAGIDAHVVLVRTRRNGSISDLPASLAVFDHAIAYVPELDLYIDGTAEHSGMTELPEQDQGVTVLHVWPSGSELRRTPVDEPQRNVRERTLDVDLATDGSATMRVEEEVKGVSAAYYRARYQAEGTREERLERSLRGNLPGLRLEAHSFGDLQDLEGPVRFSYRAEVPQLATPDGGSLRLSASSVEGLLSSMAPTPSRRHALELGAPSIYRETRRVSLPSGASPDPLPEGGVAESPFGSLRLDLTRRGQRLVVETELVVRVDRVPPGDYPAFRAWVEEADQLLRRQLTIEVAR